MRISTHYHPHSHSEAVYIFFYRKMKYGNVLRENQSSNRLAIDEELIYSGDASRCHYQTKDHGAQSICLLTLLESISMAINSGHPYVTASTFHATSSGRSEIFTKNRWTFLEQWNWQQIHGLRADAWHHRERDLDFAFVIGLLSSPCFFCLKV